jgi:hypothetical protein
MRLATRNNFLACATRRSAKVSFKSYHDFGAASAATSFGSADCNRFRHSRRSPASCQVKRLSEILRPVFEAILRDAHAKLQLVPPDAQVLRPVRVMRFGPFEVRVVQPLNSPPTTAVIFWIELFDHDRQLSIDSIGNCTMDDAVVAVEHFIARATALNEYPNAWRRPI